MYQAPDFVKVESSVKDTFAAYMCTKPLVEGNSVLGVCTEFKHIFNSSQENPYVQSICFVNSTDL